MAIVVELPADAEAMLQAQAAHRGNKPADYAAAVREQALSGGNAPLEANSSKELDASLTTMLDRTDEDRTAVRLKVQSYAIPGRPLPAGKSLQDVIAGKWPGDKTDDEIEAALRELS